MTHKELLEKLGVEVNDKNIEIVNDFYNDAFNEGADHMMKEEDSWVVDERLA